MAERKRGPKPAVADNKILEELLQFNLFDKEGSLLKESNPVWELAYDILDGKISRHNLYMKFFDNSNGIKTRFVEMKDEQESILQKSDSIIENEVSDTKKELRGLLSDIYYKPMILELCNKPLHLFYWWAEQIELYKDFIKVMELPVIISLFECKKKEIINKEETNKIRLCVLYSQIRETLVSFGQCMSVRTDTEFFIYFFGEWLRQKIPVPFHVTCPLSLLDAASQTFNFMDIKTYNIECYKSLINAVNRMPPCRIQLEKIPFLKYVEKIINNNFESECTRQFYFRTLVLVVLNEDFHYFESLMKNLFLLLKKKDWDEN